MKLLYEIRTVDVEAYAMNAREKEEEDEISRRGDYRIFWLHNAFVS